MTASAEIYGEDWPYSTVHPQQALLRYMDFWKFEDLFKTQTLYFCRADKFEDTLEGDALTKGSSRNIAQRSCLPEDRNTG